MFIFSEANISARSESQHARGANENLSAVFFSDTPFADIGVLADDSAPLALPDARLDLSAFATLAAQTAAAAYHATAIASPTPVAWTASETMAAFVSGTAASARAALASPKQAASTQRPPAPDCVLPAAMPLEAARHARAASASPAVLRPDRDYRSYPTGERGRRAGKIWRALRASGVRDDDIAVITPRNNGEDGTEALNAAIREALGFPSRVSIGDLLLVTANNYRAVTPDDETVEIYNGERCVVIETGPDFIDGKFAPSATRAVHNVRFRCDGVSPPGNTSFGYALTAQKAQGSQFDHVVLVGAPPDRFQSRSGLYTAASRAREKLYIVGDENELWRVAQKPDRQRRTLLSIGSA